jgi:hypothetical protein
MTTAVRLRRLVQLTAEAAALKQVLKERSMIYQHDEKLRVARHYGLTFEQVNLPYAEWAALRDKYHTEVEKTRD